MQEKDQLFRPLRTGRNECPVAAGSSAGTTVAMKGADLVHSCLTCHLPPEGLRLIPGEVHAPGAAPDGRFLVAMPADTNQGVGLTLLMNRPERLRTTR